MMSATRWRRAGWTSAGGGGVLASIMLQRPVLGLGGRVLVRRGDANGLVGVLDFPGASTLRLIVRTFGR